ncbi:hypothetical protein GSI_10171 [Ganoderma sinense ZZ0214-1]|uniref:Uncharacterized protein n=1 Tax=Ganoderma sinense ZZ0214-1 TaxID=1077348 RepID=A0A2G8RZT9_9APHY|nr:hypothetical protein GSI_10171 [Ganoderma sinense ZZ0214-1]
MTLPEDSCPSLITVNLDVQNHIISFLSTPDLSALMQTCRHFLDACLLPLCAHSGVILFEDDFERLPSFRLFLRIGAGSLSRAHLIRALWIAMGEPQYPAEIDPVEMLRVSKEWTPALLDILRHCHNVRRLRLDQWIMKELPYPVLIDTVASSMAHLEELDIRAPYAADLDVLRPLARLPLQRLSFLRIPYSSESHDSPPLTPFSLDVLPRSLTELDVDFHGDAPVSTPFPLVWKLGVRTMGRPIWRAFVASAATAFPNVTQLVVRRHASGGVCSLLSGLMEDTRRLSTLQWRLRARDHGASWPSLSAIWAEDLSMLYCLGFPNRVRSLSIPFRRRIEEGYDVPVLSDASPRFLELRVNTDDGFLTYSADWRAHFGPSVSSVVCLTVLHHTERNHSVKMWNGGLESAKLDELCKILPAFTSLEYLHIKFKERCSPIDTLVGPLVGVDIRYIRNNIQRRYIDLVVRANASLRWVALEMYGLRVAEEDGVGRREEVQEMAFNFDFSMPIHDTFTLSRSSNRFPAIGSSTNWSAAFLDVLRHCRNVRRIEIHSWFLQDIAFPLLLKTISSSFSQLEDLTMLMPFDTDTDALHSLSCLPLRSLAFLKCPVFAQSQSHTYVSLDTLPRSLTDLDICRSPSTDTLFLAVQKLGIRETASRTFVADATTAFPNVSHLVLRRPDMNSALGVAHNRGLLEDTRTHNKTQWESSQYRNAWRSVSVIWAEDPSLLYTLGFARRVASVSLRIGDLESEEYIQPVLADTVPSFLELRVDMDGFVYLLEDWGGVFAIGPSIRRLTLLLYARNGTGGKKGRVSAMLKCLSEMLTALPSLTHLLVRFAPTPREPGSELYMSRDCPSSTQIQILHRVIQNHLRILASSSTSLRWI